MVSFSGVSILCFKRPALNGNGSFWNRAAGKREVDSIIAIRKCWGGASLPFFSSASHSRITPSCDVGSSNA